MRRRAHRSTYNASGNVFVRKLLDIILAACLLFVIALLVSKLSDEETITGYALIIDGDSLEIGDARIRLYGIDAPELLQNCMRPDGEYPCGRLSLKALERLTAGSIVACQSKSRDRYARLIAECASADINLGEEMVRQGMAVSYGAYTAIEVTAKSDKLGIWGGRFERPEDWRRANNRQDEQTNSFATWLREKLRIIFE